MNPASHEAMFRIFKTKLLHTLLLTNLNVPQFSKSLSNRPPYSNYNQNEMLSQKYIFLILCMLILAVHAAFDIDLLGESITITKTDVNNLNSAVKRRDGMLCDIATIRAVSKLKEDIEAVIKVLEKGRPDYFSSEDSQSITIQIQSLVVKFVRGLNGLTAKVNLLPPNSFPSYVLQFRGEG